MSIVQRFHEIEFSILEQRLPWPDNQTAEASRKEILKRRVCHGFAKALAESSPSVFRHESTEDSRGTLHHRLSMVAIEPGALEHLQMRIECAERERDEALRKLQALKSDLHELLSRARE